MALLGTNLDYTDLDQEALFVRLNNLIDSVFPTWTERARANFGNMLVALFAHVGGTLTFLQNNDAREGRWSMATQRKNLIALSRLINYTPSTGSAARAVLTITLDAVLAADLVLERGQKFQTQEITDPLSFQVLEKIAMLAGTNPPTMVLEVEHSEYVDEAFVSNGLPNQSFLLGSAPFLDATLSVVASNGGYTIVSSFLDSTATDRHCTVVVDQSDRARLIFGNGVNGQIPSGTISTEYRIGGGAIGNVEPLSIQKVVGGPLLDTHGSPVQMTVTNLARADGGLDRETVAQIQLNAPASLRVLKRTVAREDYEINALRAPFLGVARALMLSSEEDPSIPENQGILYVVPPAGGAPGQTLKDAVLNRVTVEYPKTITFQVVVQDPSYLTIDVTAKVALAKGAIAATVRAAILQNLAAFFAISNADGTPNLLIDFGFNYKRQDGSPSAEIAWSDVFNVVHDTTGVRKIKPQTDDLLLNGVRADVAIALRQFPILGTVTLLNVDTGGPL